MNISNAYQNKKLLPSRAYRDPSLRISKRGIESSFKSAAIVCSSEITRLAYMQSLTSSLAFVGS